MAHNDIEVELKISLTEDDFNKVKEKIKSISRYIDTKNHTDEYFSPKHRDFVSFENPYEWLSIRNRGDRQILCYKHFYPENQRIFSHCDEFETELKNGDKLKKIFNSLNFKSLIVVNKKREEYEYKDEFVIGLDEVKELGFFIEIEALKDFGGIEKTRKRLMEFAESLEIDVSKMPNRGYPYLLMEKKGLIK